MPFEFSRLRGVRTITMLLSWVVPYSFILAVGYYGFSLEHREPIGLRAVSPNGRRVVGSVGYSEDYLVIDVASGNVTHRIKKPGRWEWWSDEEIFTLRSGRDRTNELHRCRLGANGGFLCRVESTRATETWTTPRGPLFARRVRRRVGSYIRVMDPFGDELARIPIGNAEGFSAFPTGDESKCLLQVYSESEDMERSEAYVVTDGTNAAIMTIDLDSFETNVIAQDQANCRYWALSEDYLLRVTPSRWDVIRTSSLAVVRSLPMDAFPVEVGTRFVCVTSDRISVLGQNTSLDRKFDVTGIYSACPIDDHTLLIANSDGSLARFDLRTGKSKRILTRRPFYRLSLGLAVTGVFALSWGWLIRRSFAAARSHACSSLHEPSAPSPRRSATTISIDDSSGHNTLPSIPDRDFALFDWTVVAVAACVACLLWESAAPAGTSLSPYYLRQVCSVFAFLLLAWAIVFGCQRRTVLGRLAVITSAMSVSVFLAHRLEGDAHFAPLLTMIGVLALSLAGSVLSCQFVAYRARVRMRPHLGDNGRSRQTFSLAKAMAAMAIVAPLFTVWGNVFPYIQWDVDRSISAYLLYAASLFSSSYIVGWRFQGSRWGVVVWVLSTLLQLGLYEALIATEVATAFRYSWSGYDGSYFANAIFDWSFEDPPLLLFFANSLRPVMLGAGIFLAGAKS